jgi:hypothetical protein
MSDPQTRDGELSSAEASKLAKAMAALRPKNDGIRIGGSGTWLGIVGLVLNIGGLVYFGGKFAQRLEVLEQRQTEQAQINREVSAHSVQIAVTINQLENIKASVARIESAVTK